MDIRSRLRVAFEEPKVEFAGPGLVRLSFEKVR